MFAAGPLLFKKKTYHLPIITMAAGCAGVILNIWAIPRWGIMGAAWATVAAYLMTFIMAELIGRKVFKLIYPWRKMLIVSAIWVVIILIVKALTPLITNINYYLSWLLDGAGLLAFVFMAAHVQDRKLTKLVFDKTLRIPLSQIGILAKEETIAGDMGKQ